jgi:hypothetical protein
MAYKRQRPPHIARNESGVMLPMLVTGQHLSFNSTRVQAGRRRGIRYEVWQDPLQRQLFVGIVYSPYESENGTKGEEPENIGTSNTVEGAALKADQYIERTWRGETFGYARRGRRRVHISRENPISAWDRYQAASARGEAYGLDVYDIEILHDVTRKHGNGSRRLPPPGFSLVYDRHYSKLKKLGLIRWVQVDPVYASMGDDHYVLSDTGKQVLYGPSANPLAMGRTERNVLIGAAVLGIGAIAYELFKSKPAAASTNPGTIVMPPVTIVSPGQPNQTATGTNNVDTSFTGSDGQQISMTVGDTVSVDLPVPPGATSFSFSAVGTALQAGTALASVTTYEQVWTAGSPGTSTVVFQATDAGNNPVGQPVQFTAVVS